MWSAFTRSTRTAAVAAAVGATLAAGPAVAETWDMATPYPDGNFHTRNILQFAEDVKEATGGKLEINVHSAGSLIKHPEIKNAVRSGIVPIGEFLLSRAANENPVFGVDSVPFLASDYDQAERLWTASKPEIDTLLKKEGMQVLFSVPWPPQGLYAVKPVEKMDDLKGMKFRAYNAATERVAALAGAVPTQVEVPDLPQAFATGRVEAMITSPSTGANSKAWDYVDYYYDTKAWLPKNAVVVSEKALRRLDEGTRKAVMEAAAAAQKRGWEMSKAETAEKTQMLADNGMTVSDPSPALKKGFSEIGWTMTDEWAEKAGEAGKRILKTFLSK